MSEREKLLRRKDALLDMLEVCMDDICAMDNVLISEDADSREFVIEQIESHLADAREAHDELKEIEYELAMLDDAENYGKEQEAS